MSVKLTGKRVLVVGGSGGIGSATAAAFRSAGALVSTPTRAELDILDEAAVSAYFQAEAAFEHVIVTAGTTKMGSVSSLDMQAAEDAMNSKFFGAYRVARHANITAGGSLTLVSGVLSKRPRATAVLQGAINAALEALARGLALEMAPVRVNTVSPGLVVTRLWNDLSEKDRTEMFEGAAKRLPAGCVGQPEDIAQAIYLVATNPFVTGATLIADGGATIA